LSKAETAFPLRILVTSRNIPEIQAHFLRFGKNMVSTEILLQDSMRDIKIYIQTRVEDFPLDFSQRQELADKILAKSGGCFLWVHLVLQQLSGVYTDKIWTVLDEIPKGMIPFYQKTIATMSQSTREIDIAQAIILWTIYSVRPLRTSELQEALELDIGAKVLNIKKTIEGLCGQLVYVDKSDIVQIVHPTAREFLIADTTSEFAMPERKGHERIALSCLRYLSSDEMKPPRNRRFLNNTRGDASVFREYACTAFSEHVFSASSETDTILSALDLFLRTNVLSWVEHVAQKDTLYYITRTAKNLRGYLGRRAKYLSPLGSQVERVDAWATDLTRLVAKFGVALNTAPSAIYFLIPPLCPTNSAIFKQFGISSDGLILSGVKKAVWEDCISWIDFNNPATSVASGDKAFAVGMETGDIEIYNRSNCQWERTIQHHEPIDLLKFESSGRFLASCGSRTIILWDVNGSQLWSHRLASRCIELLFQTNSLTGVSMNGSLTTWNLNTGDVMGKPQRYLYTEADDESGKTQARGPGTASISPDFDIIALGTRRASVCLLSIQDSNSIGWCSTAESDSVTLVLFNPNPNISILAVGYNTGRLAIFDPRSQEIIQSVKTGNGHQQVVSMASSPDGRTLVSADSCGTMQVWDFETLSLLYHVKSSDLGFRIVDFSSNGQRILDLGDSKLRVWEPAVLIRKTVEEDVSVSDAAVLPAIQGQDESRKRQGITAMVCHPILSAVFVGKYDGSVAAYASKTGKEDAKLYLHSKGAFVTAIAISPHDILASGDVNGTVKVWQLRRMPNRCLRMGSILLETSLGRAIQQLLISPAGGHVLISTAISSFVFSIQTGKCIGTLNASLADKGVWKWLEKTGTQPELLRVVGDKILRYSWDNFPDLLSPQALLLPPEYHKLSREARIKSAALDASDQNLIIDFEQDRGDVATKTLLILSVGSILSSTLTMSSSTAPVVLASSPAHFGLCECVKYFIGLSSNRLLFVDSESWLSSVELNGETTTGGTGEYTRHFFVPNEFVVREAGILPVLSPDKDVIFAVEGELAVVRNGLKFQSVVKVGEVERKWSCVSGAGV
jgi:WD40 repeat protein